MNCVSCKRELTRDDIGAYKKFINRGAEQFMCVECLARELKLTPEEIYKKIEYFRQMGCTLFK
ncbi:MAG: DNA-directed RNA polymerase I subunit RPA49 family protein [Clostridia bacterium]|nr:DNA-directed RNA polymerase I subunit RPA49 family protein [Clostridia bacterium]